MPYVDWPTVPCSQNPGFCIGTLKTQEVILTIKRPKAPLVRMANQNGAKACAIRERGRAVRGKRDKDRGVN